MTASSVFKLHVVVLEGRQPEVDLCTMMDNIYIVCPDSAVIRRYLSETFARLACLPIDERENHRSVVPRASVAYGVAIHDGSVRGSASLVFGLQQGTQAISTFRCAHGPGSTE